MTGTLALLAMSSNPFRSAISWPVREISPSGKRQTSSPSFSAFTESRSHCDGRSGDTSITPAILKIQHSSAPVPGPRNASEPQRPRAGELQHDDVHVGEVVRDDDRAAGLRHLGRTQHTDPV